MVLVGRYADLQVMLSLITEDDHDLRPQDADLAQGHAVLPLRRPLRAARVAVGTGRAIRNDKRGHIDQTLPQTLTRLNIDPDAWRETMKPEGNVFGRALRQLDHLRLHAKALGQQWIKGLRQAERIYRRA